jgi:hypothetical protein
VQPTSTLVVPPDATVYAIVSRRRPHFGEPRHVSPAVSRAPVRRLREAAVQRRRARHAPLRRAPRAALADRAGPRATPAEAELGCARVAVGCARRPRMRCATGPSAVSAQWHSN